MHNSSFGILLQQNIFSCACSRHEAKAVSTAFFYSLAIYTTILPLIEGDQKNTVSIVCIISRVINKVAAARHFFFPMQRIKPQIARLVIADSCCPFKPYQNPNYTSL